MRDLDDLFTALARSRFRSRFRLDGPDREYLARKTLDAVIEHGRDFVRQRLAPAQPRNDGNETPMRGHPIFVAQHATATCCRGCLAKWHRIEQDRQLTAAETDYVLSVCQRWLQMQAAEGTEQPTAEQPSDHASERASPEPSTKQQLTFWNVSRDVEAPAKPPLMEKTSGVSETLESRRLPKSEASH